MYSLRQWYYYLKFVRYTLLVGISFFLCHSAIKDQGATYVHPILVWPSSEINRGSWGVPLLKDMGYSEHFMILRSSLFPNCLVIVFRKSFIPLSV